MQVHAHSVVLVSTERVVDDLWSPNAKYYEVLWTEVVTIANTLIEKGV